MRKKSLWCILFLLWTLTFAPLFAQKSGSSAGWRAARPEELEAALPARAPVEKERIETEMRTATGIVNEHGKLIAAVVLITAGYAADGKYSHYLLLQAPLTLDQTTLRPGEYVVGWSRAQDGLLVRIFDAATGAEKLSTLAKPLTQIKRVESFRIWPPGEHTMIQIGRYMIPYKLGD